jgi:phage host-nuclease inhibitor protein Gam
MNLEQAVQTMAVAEVDTGAPEGWRVDSLESLDWALSRMADLQEEMAENERLLKEAIQRARLKTMALNERLAKGLDFFERQVRSYVEPHKQLLLKSGKKKTRVFLHGSISWRTKSARLEVKDAEAALEWARTQPVESGVLRIKEELDKRAVGALHEKTGELPPGCELTEETEELSINPIQGGITDGK